MLASTSLAEECVERIITTADSLVTGHLAIWLNAVLKAKELPARIPDLNSTLADVEAQSFTHLLLLRVDRKAEKVD